MTHSTLVSCWLEDVNDSQGMVHAQHGLCKAVTNSLMLRSTRAILRELFPCINTMLSTSILLMTRQTAKMNTCWEVVQGAVHAVSDWISTCIQSTIYYLSMVHVAVKILKTQLWTSASVGRFFEIFKFCSEIGRLAILVVFLVLRHLEYLGSETCTLASPQQAWSQQNLGGQANLQWL